MTIDEGRKGGARAAWEALGRHAPASARDVNQALEAARLAFRLGDLRLFDAWITQALALATAEGPRAAAKVHLAAASFERSAGRFLGCKRHVERVIALAPDEPALRERAGVLLHAFGAPNETSFSETSHPRSAEAEALVMRAREKSASGDPRGAVRDLLAAKHIADEAQIWVIDLELVALGRRHFGFLDVEALTAMVRGPDEPSRKAEIEHARYRRFLAPALDRAVRLVNRAWDVLPEAALAPLAWGLRDASYEEEGGLTAPRARRLRLLAHLFPEAMLARLGDPPTRTLPPLRSSARQRAKILQWSIRSRTPADVLGEFDAILRDHPRSHHPHAYRGELLLWLGRVDEAEEDFRRGLAIQPRARWLHIGMGAVHVLRSEYAAALACFQRSIDCAPALVGPTLYGVRGEAHRLRGDHSAAVEDLARTCRDTPSRASAWVNLWLAEDDLGHTDARDAAWKELTRRAPWLLADAAEEALGLALPAVEDERERRATLEHALRMLRGNRSSSCVTYFTREGELRTVFDVG
ncbi:tetratricopeptide repeat protein [Polyangium jinanense]|uniref:Tetratricopeptide repeat protein n=1 Tax=Polyangium jinanense TaxID=2829994 RepID=A0A9X3X0L5_9BACT|nr:tetratricopeptide repeat protein [Polyangium jinanense]MDC3953693.1 tetratricopeptide repeat protein [Polyangium jinanense]MDC3979186.1 tetratricopeptide repeat protein [Polyangium jinanense]